jgi:hypothetical protein
MGEYYSNVGYRNSVKINELNSTGSGQAAMAFFNYELLVSL